MSEMIVITDRETAYKELGVVHADRAGLLQFQPSRAIQFSDGINLMTVQTKSGTAIVACDPRIARDGVLRVQGVSTAHGIEVIHSLVCGYALHLLVIEGIEHPLRDPEAKAALRADLPRICDYAAACRCRVLIVVPDGVDAGAFASDVRSQTKTVDQSPQIQPPVQREGIRRADMINHMMLFEGMSFEAALQAYEERSQMVSILVKPL